MTALQCLLIVFSFMLLIESSESGLLPYPMNKYGRLGWNPYFIKQKMMSPLKLIDRIRHVRQYENTQGRKSVVDYGGEISNIVEFQPTRPLSKISPDDFDDNGMLVLAEPSVDAVKTHRLINKIIKYKTDGKANQFLRQNPQAVFASEEIEQIQDIVQAIDEDESRIGGGQSEGDDSPNSVFEFKQLIM